MIQSAFRAQEVNPAKLAQLYRKELELCQVKKGETIAVVSDLATRREYIQAAFAAADDLGADIYELCVNSLPSWTKVGVPTIGQCKGTLEAVSAADLVVVFHVPLFTRWLKDVMDGGTRVLMIIDAPDDLEQLMAPRGLKEACKYAESLYTKTKSVRVTSRSGTDLTYQCGEYPVMTQWGYADERAHFDHWGGGHIHTFPNEGSAHGTVVLQPGDIVILPYCRYVSDPVKLEIREGHIAKVEGAMAWASISSSSSSRRACRRTSSSSCRCGARTRTSSARWAIRCSACSASATGRSTSTARQTGNSSPSSRRSTSDYRLAMPPRATTRRC